MKEPRSIKDILLDIAEKPEDDFGKVLRQCPSIQKGLEDVGVKKTVTKSDRQGNTPNSLVIGQIAGLFDTLSY